MKKDVCLIVDGFSSGKLFAPELNNRGYDCIHLITNKDFYASHVKKDNDLYLETFFLEGSINAIIKKLKKYNIICALPGIEGNSVLIADELNDKLKLPGNIYALSEARRNKYLMSKVLEKNKLQSIKSIKVNSSNELIAQHSKINAFPKVIKPEAAGGSQDVYICHTENELIDAFNSAVGRMNECGVENQSMIVQPYINGKEYFINTTSCQGKHYVNDIWVYLKKISRNNEPICHGSKLLKSEGKVQDIIVPYCFEVLDALGIQNGPAHIEVILHDDLPYFIELGARLMGGAIDNKIFESSVGYSQLDATIDCFTEPDAFFAKTKQSYQLKKYLQFINVNAETFGTFEFLPLHEQIKSLPSYTREIWLVKPGDFVKKTVDDLTSIALIILQHENLETIQKDIKYVQENLSNLYKIH